MTERESSASIAYARPNRIGRHAASAGEGTSVSCPSFCPSVTRLQRVPRKSSPSNAWSASSSLRDVRSDKAWHGGGLRPLILRIGYSPS